MRWMIGALLVTVGCDQDDDTTASDDTATLDTDTDTVVAEDLTYAADVAPIMDVACIPCHLDGGMSGTFNFDNGVDDLLGNSGQLTTMPLIDPGDHQNSYFWHKINGTHLDVEGTGQTMPINADALRNRQINLVRDWIDAGANP